MKTFISICKDVGGVYWRYKKNRRASVYHVMADPIATDVHRNPSKAPEIRQNTLCQIPELTEEEKRMHNEFYSLPLLKNDLQNTKD